MTASYTFDIFSSFDGYSNSRTFGGYFGKQGPEFLEHRLEQFSEEQRLVLGANTFRGMAAMLASSSAGSEVLTYGSPGCGTCRRQSCRTPSKEPSTGRTPPS